ncbi:MAG: response regulator [Candidatus Omnitrophota bacterium]
MREKKILIIDDEVSFTNLVKLNLETKGSFTVRTESKGLNAVAAAKEFKPDMILLDIIMPDMSGGDVAFELEHDEVTKDIPIVFLTAAVKSEEVNSAEDGMIGGHTFIAKPTTVDVLLDCIEKTLTGK